MALKPILSSGVALVSAAAIVAGTPAIMPTPTIEVAHAVPTPTRVSNAKYELTALSFAGALNALFEGYDGDDSVGEALDEDNSDVEDFVDIDNWSPLVGFGVEALIYYLVDEGLATVGVNFEYDDWFFSVGQTATIFKIADDLGLLGPLLTVTDPVGSLVPAELLDPLTNPALLLPEDLVTALTNPAAASELVNLLTYLPSLLLETPLGIIADPVGAVAGTPLEGLVNALTDPVGTLTAILGAAVPGGQTLALAGSENLKSKSGILALDEAAPDLAPVEDAQTPEAKKNPFADFNFAPVLKPGAALEKAKEAAESLAPKADKLKVDEPAADKTDPISEAKAKIKESRAEAKAEREEKKAERQAKREERKAKFKAAVGGGSEGGSSDSGPAGGSSDSGSAGGSEAGAK